MVETNTVTVGIKWMAVGPKVISMFNTNLGSDKELILVI